MYALIVPEYFTSDSYPYLVDYFPKKSPSIRLRVEPYLRFSVVIFKLLLKDNIQRQSVWEVTNVQIILSS